MNEERTKILEMLAQGKITVADAERLMEAMGNTKSSAQSTEEPTRQISNNSKPKFMRIEVDEGPDGDRVNIRVPLQLLRAGVKFAGLIPEVARDKVNKSLEEKGINFDIANLKPDSLEDLVSSLGDLSLDVDGKDEKVRIYCE